MGKTVPDDARSQLIVEANTTLTLFRLALPTLLVISIQSGVTAVETYFVSRLGPTALAGVTVVFPIILLTQSLTSIALGAGVASAVARALGAGRREDADRIAAHAILLAVMLGSILTIAGLTLGPFLYRSMGASDAALMAAETYGSIIFAGMVPLWVCNIMISILRGAGTTGVPAIIGILGALSTVALSPLLIFGLGILPPLGVAGAAIANMLFYGISFLALTLYFAGKRAPVSISLRAKIGLEPFAEILRVGLPSAVSFIVTNVTLLTVTGLVGGFGAATLAGYGIGVRVEYIANLIAFAFGTSLLTMVGTIFGSGDRARSTRVAWHGSLVIMVILAVFGALATLTFDLWAGLFTEDGKVLKSAALYAMTVPPVYACLGLASALYYCFQGSGRPLSPLFVSAGQFLVTVAASKLFMVAYPGTVHAVYLGSATGLVFASGALALLLYCRPFER